MEPRKRFHPHTPAEWESFRPEFTKLYQVEEKKLAEVVDLLREKGFRANAKHCKTYIKKWGLHKNNKQKDMVFAAQKQARRNGKKTIFKSRGRERSGADVDHYWSRKKEKPTDFSPIPNTPDGLEYWTPAPTPGDTDTNMSSPQIMLISDNIDVESLRQARRPSTIESSRIVEILDDAEDNAEDNSNDYSDDSVEDNEASSPDYAMSIDTDLEPYQEYEHLPDRSPSPLAIAGIFVGAAYWKTISSYQSTTLRPLHSPETLRRQEHTLNCSKEYFQWWIEKVHRSGRNDWGLTNQAIIKFRTGGRSLVSAIQYGLSKESVDIVYLDLIKMLPSVLHQENPTSIFAVLDIFYDALRAGQQMSPKVVRFRNKVLDQASRLWEKGHPSTLLLDTLSQPDASFFDVVLGLVPGKDLISKDLSRQHDLVGTVLELLCDAAAYHGEHTESLQYAKELYQLVLSISQSRMTDTASLNLSISLLRLIFAQMNCRNYDEANELIEGEFEQLSRFHDEGLRSEKRARLLRCVGELNYEKGQFTVALDAYKEGLSLYLRLYGAGDYRTANAATWVRNVQGIVDQGSPL